MTGGITVCYRGELARLTGLSQETLPAKNVREALGEIKNRHGAPAEKAARAMLIVVNGRSILHLNLYKTRLNEKDVLSFLPICGGG